MLQDVLHHEVAEGVAAELRRPGQHLAASWEELTSRSAPQPGRGRCAFGRFPKGNSAKREKKLLVDVFVCVGGFSQARIPEVQARRALSALAAHMGLGDFFVSLAFPAQLHVRPAFSACQMPKKQNLLSRPFVDFNQSALIRASQQGNLGGYSMWYVSN